MAEPLPEALAELVAQLRDLGFELDADETDSSPFANRVVELTDPNSASSQSVRLERDRGLWAAEVLVGGLWRDPYEVLLALDKKRYSSRAASHSERRDMTLAVVSRLPESPAELEPLIERLELFRREYWRTLGVESPP